MKWTALTALGRTCAVAAEWLTYPRNSLASVPACTGRRLGYWSVERARRASRDPTKRLGSAIRGRLRWRLG